MRLVKQAMLVGILVLVVVLRYIWIVKRSPELSSGNRVKIIGTIKQEPVRKFDKQIVYLSEIRIEYTGSEVLEYGDAIDVVGRLESKVTKDQKHFFNLITGDLTKRQRGVGLNGKIGQLRRKMIDNLKFWLPGDEGALAAGILLGGTGELTKNTMAEFRRVGLSHVLAASGYNVTVVAGWVIVGLSVFMGRRRAIPVAILGIIFYVFLAGAGAAVVRAGIMASIAWIGLGFGRESDAKWLLLITGLLMLVWDPLLITDIGFQLSFAATGGILWLTGTTLSGPPPNVGGGSKGGGIWEGMIGSDLKTTLAAQAGTLPLILHHFGNLSVISPIINALVLWTVPIVMQVTAVASVAGLVVPVVGQWVAYLSWPFLKMMTEVVSWSARVPMASFQLGQMSWEWVGAYYLALVGFKLLK